MIFECIYEKYFKMILWRKYIFFIYWYSIGDYKFRVRSKILLILEKNYKIFLLKRNRLVLVNVCRW